MHSKLKSFQCFGVANYILIIISVRYGFGKHSADLEPAQIVMMEKLMFPCQILLILGVPLIKISVIVFLFRMGALRKWVKVSLLATAAVTVISAFAVLGMMLTYCKPISALWDPSVRKTAKCQSYSADLDVAYFSAGNAP